MNDTAVTTARALFPRGLHQPQDSYRFGADALLLAAFAAESLAGLPGTAPRTVAELGSGCGAALLGLCLRLNRPEAGPARRPEAPGVTPFAAGLPAPVSRPCPSASAPDGSGIGRAGQAARETGRDGSRGEARQKAGEAAATALTGIEDDAAEAAGHGVAAVVRRPLCALGLERDAALCAAARDNARLLGLDAVCRFRQGDLADTHFLRRCGENSFQLVLANPPYAVPGSGRPSPSPRREAALRGTGPLPVAPSSALTETLPPDALDVFCRAARRLLRHHGLFCCIFPAADLPRLLEALARERLGCRRILPLCPRSGEAAKRILVLARKDAAAHCLLEAPLPLHDGQGWSREALAFCPWLGAGRKEETAREPAGCQAQDCALS